MKHLDLFSGIGGFAYAADQVWPGVEHVFCDNDKFCQQVLRKHWPESEIYDDIRAIDTDPFQSRVEGVVREQATGQPRQFGGARQNEAPFLLTGGFPCQPFSAAGVRRGTTDERYLWPEMFRVIRLTQPAWVIAENVRGLATWEQGLVLEQVCVDLETIGYEVQPLIIPAVAIGAPHRRDRIWFIAANTAYQRERGLGLERQQDEEDSKPSGAGKNSITNTSRIGRQSRRIENGAQGETIRRQGKRQAERFDLSDWNCDWTKVAAELCRVDAGLPAELDGLKLSKSKHREYRIRGLGNAVVPQVAIQIMKAIKEADENTKTTAG